MSDKLTLSEAFIFLCHGARICKAQYIDFKRPYVYISKIYRSQQVNKGTITLKQLNELEESYLIMKNEERTDAHGNTFVYYVLEDYVLYAARNEYLRRGREKKNETN